VDGQPTSHAIANLRKIGLSPIQRDGIQHEFDLGGDVISRTI